MLYCCCKAALRRLIIAIAHGCGRPNVFPTFSSPSEASWIVIRNTREVLQTAGYADIQYTDTEIKSFRYITDCDELLRTVGTAVDCGQLLRTVVAAADFGQLLRTVGTA